MLPGPATGACGVGAAETGAGAGAVAFLDAAAAPAAPALAAAFVLALAAAFPEALAAAFPTGLIGTSGADARLENDCKSLLLSSNSSGS